MIKKFISFLHFLYENDLINKLWVYIIYLFSYTGIEVFFIFNGKTSINNWQKKYNIIKRLIFENFKLLRNFVSYPSNIWKLFRHIIINKNL